MSRIFPDLERPYAFVQWKGTDVCCDVYCVCGAQGHIDSEFMYAVRCPKCGAVYEVASHIELRRVEGPWNGCEPLTWEPDDEDPWIVPKGDR